MMRGVYTVSMTTDAKVEGYNSLKKKNLIRSILLRVNYKCGSDPETWKHEN